MKASDFSAVLRALADTLSNVGAARMHDDLGEFARLFDLTPSATVAAVVKRLGTVDLASTQGGASVGQISDILTAAGPVFATIAKPTVSRDVDLLRRFLATRSAWGLSDLIAAAASPGRPPSKAQAGKTKSADGGLVARYHGRLEEARGDEARFLAVFNELKSDAGVGPSEVAELAKAFTGFSAKSKTDGLRRIWNRQQEIMTARAKAAATGGRSAA